MDLKWVIDYIKILGMVLLVGIFAALVYTLFFGVKENNERKTELMGAAMELKQTGVCAVSGIITEQELDYLIRASRAGIKHRKDLFGYTLISLRPIELDFQPAEEQTKKESTNG